MRAAPTQRCAVRENAFSGPHQAYSRVAEHGQRFKEVMKGGCSNLAVARQGRRPVAVLRLVFIFRLVSPDHLKKGPRRAQAGRLAGLDRLAQLRRSGHWRTDRGRSGEELNELANANLQ